MQAHCIHHVPFEGMASIESWLNKKNFRISFTKLYENGNFPDTDKIDWLIIMGGPMSVNDEAEFPWIIEEKAYIKECIDKGKTVIGICLGAQFIASVLGSAIFKNPLKEIGWFPITKNGSGNSLFGNLPDNLTVFHWHGETFDLPKGAELIASSEGCRNQIFTFNNNRVIGFHCHLETTKESLRAISDNCKSEIIPGTYIQTIEQMEEGVNKYAGEMNKALFDVLERLL